jgi:hypothetical protein
MRLDVTKKTIFECGSFALDEFLSELFGTSFEFEAAEELGDGDVRTFDVHAEEMSASDFDDIARGDWVYETESMLNHACARGFIEPGEYVIHNRM